MNLEQAIERVSKPPELGVRWDARDCEAGRLLCAEIARLTALLAEARVERVEAAKRLSKQAARWLDDFIADSELIDAINGELDAALAKLGA